MKSRPTPTFLLHMQKTISLKDITVDFGTKTVLDHVSVRFAVPDRVSVVGENGEGKSTLLKVIAGTLEPSDGVVHKSNGTRVHYVPQEFLHEHMDLTVEAYLTQTAGHQVYQRIEQLAKDMGFSVPRHKDTLCRSLSGGQQKIIALAVGVALRPDFLLLDEPENHLDIVTRKKMLHILQNFPGALICISHDRGVIDTLARSVLEVAKGKLHLSEGGYADYRAARLRRIEGAQRTFDTEEKRITQLKKAYVIAQQKAYRGKETAAYHRIKDELETLKQSHKDDKRAADTFTKIKLSSSTSDLHQSKLLLKVTDLTYGYPGEKPLFKKLTFDIRVGSHIVLLGRNGSGKSTLLKLLEGRLTPQSGTAEWAPGISVRYFDQHMNFNPQHTPCEVVEEHFGVSAERAKAILGSVKFDLERMERPLESLSGGERMRVKFAIVFGMNPDVIVLDEPTNHVDITTWDILLEQCNKTTATLILVTHDEEFITELEPKLFYVLNQSELKVRHKTLDELLTELSAH
jgi:ATPase subunit of ABC transporter with duplicated ATPase domains